jgi:hypothetical protein
VFGSRQLIMAVATPEQRCHPKSARVRCTS